MGILRWSREWRLMCLTVRELEWVAEQVEVQLLMQAW